MDSYAFSNSPIIPAYLHVQYPFKVSQFGIYIATLFLKNKLSQKSFNKAVSAIDLQWP